MYSGDMMQVIGNLKIKGDESLSHVCLRVLGGDQLPIPTRYKILAKSRGIYTCTVKVLAWGGPVPPTPTYGHFLVFWNWKIAKKTIWAKIKRIR